MRLDKYLSKAKFITRNEARKLIKSGNVKVNNQVVKKQNYLLDVDFDIVLFNDEKLEYSKFHYYMLNKPQGVISATVDKNYKTVRDLIDTPLDLHPVGRLDKDTEGLLLLMDNGLLSHKIGRASCRERVKTSVVAVSLETNWFGLSRCII